MKKRVGFVCLLLALTVGAEAQTKGKTGTKKGQVTNNKTTAKKTPPRRDLNSKNSNTGTTTILSSTGTYNAYGSPAAETGRLHIADPVIRTLKERAFSITTPEVSGSGIIGMPKLTYGLANGSILFRPTDSPTSGTSTGSGSVGTGTNVGPVGTSGNAIGVNGKNPYAGPGIYGLPIADENITPASTERTRPKGIRRKD